MSDRIRQAAAVWAVLNRYKDSWLTAEDLTRWSNELLRSQGHKGLTTASATARARDFRKPKYGGHIVACKRAAGYPAPVYRLIEQ